MTKTNYHDILKHLAELTNYEKNVRVPYKSKTFDLDQFKAFLKELGSPHLQLKAVLIAGTSGKGATGRIVTELLRQSGCSVAFFSSPHLLNVRERIEFNGGPISERDFAENACFLLEHEHFAHKGSKGLRTFFEFLTALAIVYFRKCKPDFSIFEVGVGGRLDATNVFQPRLSIVTPIGVDHQHWLGRTKRLIAREKAGIIHDYSPVICARQTPAVMQVLEGKARRTNSPLFVEGRDFRVRLRSAALAGCRFDYTEQGMVLKNLQLSLAAPFQIRNAGLALKAFSELTAYGEGQKEAFIRAGLNSVSWPGRLQIVRLKETLLHRERFLILDGAHNTLGMGQLVRSLGRLLPGQKFTVIAGFARDKQSRQMIKQLSPVVSTWFLTRFSSERAADPAVLARLVPHCRPVSVVLDPVRAITSALEQTDPHIPVLVTGSLYLVADILALLQRPERDREFTRRFERLEPSALDRS